MPPLKIVIIGHVDHGKSTVVGRLLAGTGAVPADRLEQVRKICAESGKPFEYAFLLDALEEEQRQGVTIDLVRVPFQSRKRSYELIDAPGHKEFLKNMISGAASADAAVILIDANEGIREQSLRHGQIVSLMGITQVIVLVNKMDATGYRQEAFQEVVREYGRQLRQMGIFPVEYIPASALAGENLITRSAAMPWFAGNSLLEALDALATAADITEAPFRLPVQDVYKFDRHRIIAGKIAGGTIRIGEEVVFLPSGKTGVIKSFEAWNRQPPQLAVAGESVGITLQDQIFIERGETCVRPTERMRMATALRANIIWMAESHLTGSKKYLLKLGTQEVECRLSRIENRLDSAVTEAAAAEVAINEIAQVILTTTVPLCFDAFQDAHETGRFVLFDGFELCGGGTIAANQTIDPDFTI